jgi:hypothetical protein
MKHIKDFFKKLEIKLSYGSFCAAVRRLGSPQLALAHYQNPVVQQKVSNKQNHQSFDKYQRLARENGLQTNYISYWANKLETTKDIIADEIRNGDFDQPYKDAYLYKTHEEKLYIAKTKQPTFLRFKFK